MKWVKSRCEKFVFIESVFSHATPETNGKYEYSKQVPQYSHQTELNIFNTKRRMSLRKVRKHRKRDKFRKACFVILGRNSLKNGHDQYEE
jgi:hypothetical protein